MKSLSFFPLLFIFCFSILSFSALALGIIPSQIIFNESFAYSDDFSNHGWTYAESNVCRENTPYNDGINNGFGGFQNAGCINHWRYIRQQTTLYLNQSQNIDKVISWDFYSNSTEVYVRLRLGDNYGDNDLLLAHHETGFPNKGRVYIGGGLACSFDISTGADLQNYIIHLRAADNKADIYYQNSKVCEDLSGLGTQALDKLELYDISSTGLSMLDNVIIANGTVGISVGGCDFPLLFCDEFDYTTPLYTTKNWNIYNSDNSLNVNFAPDNNSVMWNATNPKKIEHDIESFPVNYSLGDSRTVTLSYFTPSFSNEFDILLYNDSNIFLDFYTEDTDGDECFRLRFTDVNDSYISLSYKNRTDNSYKEIAQLTPNEYHTIKANARFSSVNKTDLFLFNTTYDENHILLYADSSELTNENDYFNAECDSIWYSRFIRQDSSTNLRLDDYYMYAGFDKYTSTIDIDRIDIEKDVYNISVIYEEGQLPDVSTSLEDFWRTTGFITDASKILLALVVMVIVALAVTGAFISAHIQPNFGVIAGIEILLAIFFTYMGLLPVWIIIVLIMLGVGGSALYIKHQTA